MPERFERSENKRGGVARFIVCCELSELQTVKTRDRIRYGPPNDLTNKVSLVRWGAIASMMKRIATKSFDTPNLNCFNNA